MHHMHHIIPRHAGGTNDPSNLVKLSVEEHAEAHKKLWEQYGRKEDWIAWKGLSGTLPKEKIVHEANKINGLKGNKKHVERYKSDPEYAAWCRQRQSKPKSTTVNYFKPKTQEHADNIRKAALKRERIVCSSCGKGYTKANIAKHERACKGK